MPSDSDTSFSDTGPPPSCSARYSIKRTAYRPFVEIFMRAAAFLPQRQGVSGSSADAVNCNPYSIPSPPREYAVIQLASERFPTGSIAFAAAPAVRGAAALAGTSRAMAAGSAPAARTLTAFAALRPAHRVFRARHALLRASAVPAFALIGPDQALRPEPDQVGATRLAQRLASPGRSSSGRDTG